MASVSPLTFRLKDTVDRTSTLNRWLSPSCDAIQVTADTVADVLDWCGGEPAYQPGKLIAVRGWTATYQTAGLGDWIVLARGSFRVIYENDFTKYYEADE